MKLAELVEGMIDINEDIGITGLALDSRKVQSGYLFFAVAGAVQHGMEHIEQAMANGAAAALYDPAGKGQELAEAVSGIRLWRLPGLSDKLGEIAAKFYRWPSQLLKIIGVTGTNGKTSCSQFLAQALEHSGVIGTMGWGSGAELNSTLNTTPDALVVQRILYEFVKQQKQTVVMEVSSHGIQQGRINGIDFVGALFTNLSRDHLDYHGSMEEYLAVKMKLLKKPGLSFVVLNLDDDNTTEILNNLTGTVKKWGFTCEDKVNQALEIVAAQHIKHRLDGIQFDVCWQGQRRQVNTSIAGSFNVENLLAVVTVLLAMEMPLEQAINRLEALQPVPGRMENFGGEDKPVVFVDYAHSPDALEKVLAGLKPHCQSKLKVIFGCGGDRDQGKRPQMGAVAEKWADEVILTDDNPRSERPDAIIKDILSGCHEKKLTVIHDRAKAIQAVISNADKRDCIVIAGKGHENYQEVQGTRLPFSDQQVVRKSLREWLGAR